MCSIIFSSLLWRYALMNASNSSFTLSLCVVHMPCGAPLQTMLSWSVRRRSRYRAERGGHFIEDLCPDAEAVSLDDPARFVIRNPSFAGCILPDECLQWQVDSDCPRGLHQRRAAAGVTEDDEVGWRQRQSHVRRSRGGINSGKDCHPVRANLCLQSVHRLFWTELAPNAGQPFHVALLLCRECGHYLIATKSLVARSTSSPLGIGRNYFQHLGTRAASSLGRRYESGTNESHD